MKPYCILPQAGNFHPCWDCSWQNSLPALPLAGWEACELQSPHIWKVLCRGRQTYCILWHRIMLRMSFWFCNMHQLVVPSSLWGDIISTLLLIFLTQLTQLKSPTHLSSYPDVHSSNWMWYISRSIIKMGRGAFPEFKLKCNRKGQDSGCKKFIRMRSTNISYSVIICLKVKS